MRKENEYCEKMTMIEDGFNPTLPIDQASPSLSSIYLELPSLSHSRTLLVPQRNDEAIKWQLTKESVKREEERWKEGMMQEMIEENCTERRRGRGGGADCAGLKREESWTHLVPSN